jgi:mycofactocin precursor
MVDRVARSADQVGRRDRGYPASMDETTVNDSVETETTDVLVEEELLVEEISIDGMCGVY